MGVTDGIEEHREELEALAERSDLNSSKYARALLNALEDK